METRVDEIAPDIYRLSSYIAKIDLQFNQFLVTDEEPLLFHTGMRGMFEEVLGALAKVIDPARLRWISFSHFESDECGALNQWLSVAPRAEVFCGTVASLVNINDYTGRKSRVMATGEILETGRHRYRFLETPQVPHSWDASLIFDETARALFSSDLLLQNGNVSPVTEQDVVGAAREALLSYESGPLAHPFPYSSLTDATLQMLAGLKPELIATMHGSSFRGDGERALRDLAAMYALNL
jgi:flavorubredoxin